MKSRSKILFISHDSSLTGAPVLLLNLVSLCRERGLDIYILLMRGGKLEDKFRELGETYVLKPADYRKNAGFVKQVFQYAAYRARRIKILRAISGCDLVLNNTLANGSILGFFKKRRIPVLTYVHELESVISQLNEQGQADLSFRDTDLFLCPSKAVAANLQLNHGIDPEKIRMLPYYFPRPEVLAPAARGLEERFGIPTGRFYVVGMGTATYRKGFDLFLEICRVAVSRDPGFYFIWIGGFVDNGMKKWYEETGNNVPGNSFTMTGEVPRDPANLAGGDIFLLPSREDPYPLVVIEAAQAGVPTVFFEGSGGIDDFVDDATGWPLAGINVEQVVDLLLSLKNNKDLVREKGAAARKKASRLHENGEEIFRRCASIFEEV